MLICGTFDVISACRPYFLIDAALTTAQRAGVVQTAERWSAVVQLCTNTTQCLLLFLQWTQSVGVSVSSFTRLTGPPCAVVRAGDILPTYCRLHFPTSCPAPRPPRTAVSGDVRREGGAAGRERKVRTPLSPSLRSRHSAGETRNIHYTTTLQCFQKEM